MLQIDPVKEDDRGWEPQSPTLKVVDLASVRRASAAVPAKYGTRVPTGQIVKGPMHPQDRDLFELFCSKLKVASPKGRQLRERSIDHYRKATEQFLCWAYEYKRPVATQVTHHDVDDWRDILAAGDERHDPPLDRHSEAYVRNRFGGARIFFSWLLKREEIKVDPFLRADKPTVHAKGKQPATREQLTALRHTLEHPGKGKQVNYRDLAITGFLYDSGLRASELCNLRDRSIDRERKRVFVDGDNVGTKSHLDRKVRVSAETLYFYKRYREEGSFPQPEFAFNGTQRWGKLGARGLHAIVKRAWKLTGLPGVEGFGVHTFRHTLATHVLEDRSMSETELMNYMGWAEYSMLLNYTRRLNPERAADAAEDANIGYGSLSGDGVRRRRPRNM